MRFVCFVVLCGHGKRVSSTMWWRYFGFCFCDPPYPWKWNLPPRGWGRCRRDRSRLDRSGSSTPSETWKCLFWPENGLISHFLQVESGLVPVIFWICFQFSIFDLILFGQTKSLTTNSKVKKMMMMLSIVSMMNTTVGNCTLPLESWNDATFKLGLVVLVVSTFCSSSAVEMMKVRVEINTWSHDQQCYSSTSAKWPYDIV